VFGVAPAIVQWARYVAYVYGKMPPWPTTTTTYPCGVFFSWCKAGREHVSAPDGFDFFDAAEFRFQKKLIKVTDYFI